MKTYFSIVPSCGVCGNPCVLNPVLPPKQQAKREYGLATFYCDNEKCAYYHRVGTVKADLVEVPEVVFEEPEAKQHVQ